MKSPSQNLPEGLLPLRRGRPRVELNLSYEELRSA
jgi:hypothetical protein